MTVDRMLVKRTDTDGDRPLAVRLDGHRRALVRWVGRHLAVAHLVDRVDPLADRVGLLVALVLRRLLDRIDLILVLALVLEVLVLLVLQAHLHPRLRAPMIPINVKVWDPAVMVGMWS
ncbi:MAG: hypothetical protein GY772_08130 [bacterium]|nr:hypothetical protein [bacterium]